MYKWLWAVFLALSLSGCDRDKLGEKDAVKDISQKNYGGNFNLTDMNGKPRTLTDFKGKVVVLFFGYTHCPDVCPTTLSDLQSALQQLGDQAEKVQVLFVTVDPERDTPKILQEYLSGFGPHFLGLYGDAEETAKTAREFKASYEKVQIEDSMKNYAMDHTAGCYLIDKNGKVQLLLEYGIATEKIVSSLKKLL